MTGIKQLEIFTKVIDENSFTVAAEALFMSQPAVSWQIKRLEEELKTELIKRKDKNIELTETGKIFYTSAKEIVGLYRQTLASIDSYNNCNWGKLIIGASTVPGQFILPKVITQYAYDFPQTHLDIIIKNSSEILAKLANAEIDIALVGCEKNISGIHYDAWLEDEIVAICGKDFPAPNVLTQEDFKDLPFILREDSSGTEMTIKKELLRIGIDLEHLNKTISIYGNTGVISLVEANAGIAFISKNAIQKSLNSGDIRQLEIENLKITRPLYIAYRKTEHPMPHIITMLKLLKSTNLN